MLHAIIITSIITCIYGGISLPALVPVNAKTNDLPAAPANDLPVVPADAMTNDLPAAPVTALDIVNNPSMIDSIMTNPHALVSLMVNDDPGKVREVISILTIQKKRSNQAIEHAIALLEGVVQGVAPNGARPALLADTCGGWRESPCGGVFFAAMVSSTWNTTFNYRCPDGFRWITSDEYTENYGQSSTCDRGVYNVAGTFYHGQCGWNGFTYAGVFREVFRFSDSTLTNGKAVHADSTLQFQYLDSQTSTRRFAGIVCSAE